jgi:anti-sigma factor RsiW
MNDATKWENPNINSLVDGELDSNESAALLGQLENDPKMQRELCDIHRLKDMMKMAYPDAALKTSHGWHGRNSIFGTIAASFLLLIVGYVSGVSLSDHQEIVPFQLSQVQTDPAKLVLLQ